MNIETKKQRDKDAMNQKGYHCCSNSSLKACQELKEAE